MGGIRKRFQEKLPFLPDPMWWTPFRNVLAWGVGVSLKGCREQWSSVCCTKKSICKEIAQKLHWKGVFREDKDILN